MRSPALLATLALAACVPAARVPAPELVRAPPPSVSLAPPRAADWRDWPATGGTWTYRRDARGSVARFGTGTTNARLTLRCDLIARRINLSHAGTQAAPLAIRTSTTARTVAVQPAVDEPGYVTAALTPTDALLDAIAFSRGRFVVEQSGAPALVVPAWPEIGRVIEDCRG